MSKEERIQRWTIGEPFAGRYRRFINHGGQPYWCEFDYAVAPAPDVDGIAVTSGWASDPDSEQCFPDLKRGMESGWVSVRESGKYLTGIRVVVNKIVHHPLDTPEDIARAGRHYGHSFVWDLAARCVAASPSLVEGDDD